MTVSQRADGRGHWPAGKRRNVVRLRSWDSVELLLAAVRDYCSANRKLQQLADHLGVDRKTVHSWLTLAKIPRQATAVKIAAWYRQETRQL